MGKQFFTGQGGQERGGATPKIQDAGRGRGLNLRGGEGPGRGSYIPSSSIAPRMIFGTWLSWKISMNKVRSPVRKKKRHWVKGNFILYFFSTIIHKDSSQFWILQYVKDDVSCISCWQAGLGIVQCWNIFHHWNWLCEFVTMILILALQTINHINSCGFVTIHLTFSRTPQFSQKNSNPTNQTMPTLGFRKLFDVFLFRIGRDASQPGRDFETFSSRQMYLYLYISLVERKRA